MRAVQSGVERGFDRLSDRLGLVQVPVTVIIPGGQSQTITLTEDASVLITLWGGGGAGAPYNSGNGRGGHSGAVCRRRLKLSQGATIDVTAGRGQCRSSYPQITSATRGATASTATINDPVLGSINMSAGAGPTNANGTIPSPAVATGGDLNLPGLIAGNFNGASSPSGTDADGLIAAVTGGIGINTTQGSSTYKAENGFTPGAGGGCAQVQAASLSEPGDGGDGLAVITYTVTR